MTTGPGYLEGIWTQLHDHATGLDAIVRQVNALMEGAHDKPTREERLRHMALSCAVDLHEGSQPYQLSAVMTTAREFYEFLSNGNSEHAVTTAGEPRIKPTPTATEILQTFPTVAPHAYKEREGHYTCAVCDQGIAHPLHQMDIEDAIKKAEKSPDAPDSK